MHERWRPLQLPPTPATLWAELRRRSPVLAFTGALHLMLLLATMALLLLDSREVLGINVWIKPMKFMASLTIYLWTIAWLIGYIENARGSVLAISRGISTCMIIETACLLVQACRGVRSHFNHDTPFDSTVFGIMGVGIAIDTLLMIWMLALFLRGESMIPRVYLWGIRLGIVVFLVGAVVGGMMSDNEGHTIGAVDGGPGLPFLNWRIDAGDLRVAHAFGLHGLQIMPFLGYILSRRARRTQGSSYSLAILVSITVIYSLLILATLLQALSGRPFAPL